MSEHITIPERAQGDLLDAVAEAVKEHAWFIRESDRYSTEMRGWVDHAEVINAVLAVLDDHGYLRQGTS